VTCPPAPPALPWQGCPQLQQVEQDRAVPLADSGAGGAEGEGADAAEHRRPGQAGPQRRLDRLGRELAVEEPAEELELLGSPRGGSEAARVARAQAAQADERWGQEIVGQARGRASGGSVGQSHRRLRGTLDRGMALGQRPEPGLCERGRAHHPDNAAAEPWVGHRRQQPLHRRRGALHPLRRRDLARPDTDVDQARGEQLARHLLGGAAQDA
jgi:hypothetical protein